MKIAENFSQNNHYFYNYGKTYISIKKFLLKSNSQFFITLFFY
ncbi:hypothetical protein CKSOR_00446 [Candidatus Kinetoplastibacterium sorsogonicusi]|uniref:Uncharacterized protein n=1 Tax=Candidatus Kinetoplastidibacterium kentomonadis TaxID=1576550 RepID=A0A3S7JA62_9PROT|nr:hypothetical protein CKSOR_00446 [Candidatus Kinetoplastibacterium sorsogonicusi]